MTTITKYKNERVCRDIYKKTLESGLKIFVIPDKFDEYNKTRVNIVVNYGGMDLEYIDRISGEVKRIPEGVAHFIEHLMFYENGRSSQEINEIFKRLNCYTNAFTYREKTVYFFETEDEYINPLKKMIKMIFKPYFTQENIDKEHNIICSEIDLTKDHKSIINVIYPNHYASASVIGSKQSISNITPELLYNIYENYYTPNNMAIIIRGNLVPYEVFSVVEEMIKRIGIKYKPKPTRVVPKIKKHSKKNLKGTKDETEPPTMQLGFLIKDINYKERVKLRTALELFTIMNFSFESSFSEGLKRNLLDDSNFGFDYLMEDNLFIIIANTKKPYAMKKELIEYIKKIKFSKFSENKFNIAKKVLINNNIEDYVYYINDVIEETFLKNIRLFEDVDVLENMDEKEYKYYINKLYMSLDEAYMFYKK